MNDDIFRAVAIMFEARFEQLSDVIRRQSIQLINLQKQLDVAADAVHDRWIKIDEALQPMVEAQVSLAMRELNDTYVRLDSVDERIAQMVNKDYMDSWFDNALEYGSFEVAVRQLSGDEIDFDSDEFRESVAEAIERFIKDGNLSLAMG